MSGIRSWNPGDAFALFDLGLLEHVGLEAWLESTVARCAEWFQASGVSLFLADPEGCFVLAANAGTQSTVPPGARIVPGVGVAGHVLIDGQARILGDLDREPGFAALGLTKRDDLSSSMVVPLLEATTERIGVLSLSRSAGEPAFVEGDLAQATALASLVSMAVANARLVTELHDSLGQLWLRNEQLAAVLSSVPAAVRLLAPSGEPLSFGGRAMPESLAVEAAAARAADRAASCREATAERVLDAASGASFWIHASPVRSGGAVVVVQDITDIEQAEQEAARLARLAEIGQMTAALAHEIRNPLTGIRGAAQTILTDPALANEFAGVVVEEADRLERLCEDFLALSRPVTVAPRPAILAQTLDKACRLVRPQFEAAGVVLEQEATEPDSESNFDPARVIQVAQNLLRNALQATQAGGTVTVTSGRDWFAVRDNGSGMDERTLAGLFSPFFTTKADGTGLGLTTSRQIVEAHGGRIDVVSSPGEGTVFTVRVAA
jgi:signal transduction histidine kinase